MANKAPAKIDPKAIKNAEATWAGFVHLSKISTYAVCGLLVALWLVFIA
tara:strand:+ start:16068 stop:16214 length:147 start_codon:yes stop_codon:yes gene_type:complete